jgi:PST family polysaccharide transporter
MEAGEGSYFEDLKASEELGRLARRGGVASVASVYANGVLQIVGAIVLARLLTPEDFGLVAIVMVLTRFAPLLIDFGVADAIIQKSKITQNEISTLFWVNSGIGIALALGLAVCSPLIAWLYEEPRLGSVAMCFAITFVFTGMSGQHLSLLRRTMQFVAIAKIQIVSALAGFAVAILIAISGCGYWALVMRPIVSAVCMTAGAWLTWSSCLRARSEVDASFWDPCLRFLDNACYGLGSGPNYSGLVLPASRGRSLSERTKHL